MSSKMSLNIYTTKLLTSIFFSKSNFSPQTDTTLTHSPDPTTSTDYVKVVNDSIKVVTQNLTWGKAKEYCEGDGAKLANLRNEWKQAYVEMMALNLQAPLWIGLNKMEVRGLRASQTAHSKRLIPFLNY